MSRTVQVQDADGGTGRQELRLWIVAWMRERPNLKRTPMRYMRRTGT